VPPLKSSHRIALDACFDRNKHCAFNLDELSECITGNRAAWGFPKSWSIQRISRILLEGGWLQTVSLTSDLYRSKTRFASVVRSKATNGGQVKTGNRMWPGT
jgi:hypothetical protein